MLPEKYYTTPGMTDSGVPCQCSCHTSLGALHAFPCCHPAGNTFDTLQLLRMWCVGFNIDPKITARFDFQQYLKNKDGVGIRDVVRRYREALDPREPMQNIGDIELLELLTIVNNDDAGFAFISSVIQEDGYDHTK